jgi:alcohol dehydrogenase (cytochrome c)
LSFDNPALFKPGLEGGIAIFDEISEHPIINAKVNGEDRKLVVHAARNGFFYALDRVNGSFVHGKQYVDQLNWTTGLDPKTGRPLN